MSILQINSQPEVTGLEGVQHLGQVCQGTGRDPAATEHLRLRKAAVTLWVNPHPQAREGVTPKHNKLKKKMVRRQRI